jgi:hypothetical protein
MADPKQQQDINQLSTQDKLSEALNRALPLLPKEVRERVQELASPESVSAIATIGAVYVASHAVGIGEFGDAAILGFGVATLGSEALNVLKDLSSFVQDATQAKNGADLDRAAEHLASAVSKVSVDAVLAVLAHKAGKVVEEKLPRSAERGVVNESQMKTPSVPERPPLPRESGQTPKKSEEVVAQLGSYVDNPALSERLRTPEEFEALAKDPAKNYQINANSKVERMVALELENRGLLNHVVRDTRKLPVGAPSGDVIEGGGAGQIWDIKGFNSSFSPKKGGYTLEKSLEAIKEEFDNGENVIIDTTKMYPEHIVELHQAVVERGWSERVLWDDPQLSPSKTIQAEISQSKQTSLSSVSSALPVIGAATAQQTQSAEAKEASQPQFETSVSAKIISNDQSDALKSDNQPQPDPILSAVQAYEKLISTQGQYDSYYNVTRFKEGEYIVRLNNSTKVLSIESTDRDILLMYDQNTQKLTVIQPLEGTEIQHFKDLQNILETSIQENPKVEQNIRLTKINSLETTGLIASAAILPEQIRQSEPQEQPQSSTEQAINKPVQPAAEPTLFLTKSLTPTERTLQKPPQELLDMHTRVAEWRASAPKPVLSNHVEALSQQLEQLKQQHVNLTGKHKQHAWDWKVAQMRGIRNGDFNPIKMDISAHSNAHTRFIQSARGLEEVKEQIGKGQKNLNTAQQEAKVFKQWTEEPHNEEMLSVAKLLREPAVAEHIQGIQQTVGLFERATQAAQVLGRPAEHMAQLREMKVAYLSGQNDGPNERQTQVMTGDVERTQHQLSMQEQLAKQQRMQSSQLEIG